MRGVSQTTHTPHATHLEFECGLDDARGTSAGEEDILVRGHELRLGDAVQVVEEELGRLAQLWGER